MTPGYLKIKDAAHYCGYSYDRFRQLAKHYRIPRKGPGKNRFSRFDLDLFMDDPTAFSEPGHLRRQPGRFTPVT